MSSRPSATGRLSPGREGRRRLSSGSYTAAVTDAVTDQAGDRRPRRIAVAVALLAVWWLVLLGLDLSSVDHGLRGMVGLAAFTVFIGFVLYRFWLGRPTVWYVIVRFALPVGVVTLVGPLWLYLYLKYSDAFAAFDDTKVPPPYVAVVDGTALLAGGIIARTASVRAWCHRARSRG